MDGLMVIGMENRICSLSWNSFWSCFYSLCFDAFGKDLNSSLQALVKTVVQIRLPILGRVSSVEDGQFWISNLLLSWYGKAYYIQYCTNLGEKAWVLSCGLRENLMDMESLIVIS